MKINVLTLFPEILNGTLQQSILKRASDKNIIDLNIINIRDFTNDKHHTVDEPPYGGGPGMVMKVEPIYHAVQSVTTNTSKLILLTPAGKRYSQETAKELAKENNLIFICGHYEGIDERVKLLFNPLCLSVGDYVLTNGALAACVIIDSVVRLLPGVLGNNESIIEESFENNLVEYPQYTRPSDFMGLKVPDVLLSGNHKSIAEWRKEQAKKRTNKL